MNLRNLSKWALSFDGLLKKIESLERLNETKVKSLIEGRLIFDQLNESKKEMARDENPELIDLLESIVLPITEETN